MEIDLESAFSKTVYISPHDFLALWLTREPTTETKQDCLFSNNGTIPQELLVDILHAAKLALIAYAMPMLLPMINNSFHQPNMEFMRDFELTNMDPEFQAMMFQRMNEILDRKIDRIHLHHEESFGYYIRTPIRIWRDNKRIYHIPSWEEKDQLIDDLIIGNNNCYVLKSISGEIRILFRGTSNEFNAIPQYGKQLSKTQIFHLPDYCIDTNEFFPNGSEEVPLFYFYYWTMVRDLLPFILQAISQLGQFTRIIVTGHSMGGGLTITFAYMLKLMRPDLFSNCVFRTFASPLCCNDAASVRLTQWMEFPHQFIDVVNYDDFVNVQYMFGGQQAFQESMEAGVSSVLAWLVKSGLNKRHRSESSDWLKQALQSIRLNTDVVMALFLNQASVRQPRKASHSSHPRRLTHQSNVDIVFCKRRYYPAEEYLGRAHDEYMNVSMALFWTPLRLYENALYNDYFEHSLKRRNHLILLPIGDVEEMREVEIWQPSRELLELYFSHVPS